MVYLIYNLLLYLYFLVTSPFYIFKFFTSEKYRGGLKQRLGFISPLKHKPRILVHAVSVGEFLAAVPLVNALKKELPEYRLVISTTTTTGNKVAGERMEERNNVVFFPLDFTWAVERFFNRISPDLIVLVETELWPNFLRVAKKRKIPVIVVNGRISVHSFKNYSKLKSFFSYMSNDINAWGMQFEGDGNRLKELRVDAKRIYITGSLKIDSAIQRTPDPERINEINNSWRRSPEALILVGGSTHRGEERILLDLYRDLKDNFKNLVLIIAPRHPERIEGLKKLLDIYKFNYILRSEWTHDTVISNYEVVLVDTLGELISIYSLADVVFIGKSMKKGGGQNLLEPAALDKAVICGPLMDNFSEITEWMVRCGGIIQVRDGAELKRAVKRLLDKPQERDNLGKRAGELVKSTSGATERNVDIIKRILKYKDLV